MGTEHVEKPVRRRGRRIWLFRLTALTVAMLAALLAGEGVVRLLGETDADGNFFLRGRQVGAHRPQVEWVRERLQEYLTTDKHRMIYDPWTGWKPKPNTSSHGGRYRYNAAGIRSAPTEYALDPRPGTLRIALFGDSFTHGDDVPFEGTWGRLLEERLSEAGIPAEVINFGVSAYGMDQAFLRWQRLGREYNPHLVLFGFQAENVARNVNILRGFYVAYTGIPFSKPRFVLDEEGRLKPVNLPAMPIERVPEVMANMGKWELARHEWFYEPSDYRRRFWDRSRLLSLVADVLSGSARRELSRPESVFPLDGEPARVTRELLRAFRDDVERRGAEFLIVHLPRQDDLLRIRRGRDCVYGDLLERLAQEHSMIDPQPRLLRAAEEGSPEALIPRHYSAEGGRILADVIAEFIRARVRTGGRGSRRALDQGGGSAGARPPEHVSTSKEKPGSSGSQGGEGLQLLPGAIGCVRRSAGHGLRAGDTPLSSCRGGRSGRLVSLEGRNNRDFPNSRQPGNSGSRPQVPATFVCRGDASRHCFSRAWAGAAARRGG